MSGRERRSTIAASMMEDRMKVKTAKAIMALGREPHLTRGKSHTSAALPKTVALKRATRP